MRSISNGTTTNNSNRRSPINNNTTDPIDSSVPPSSAIAVASSTTTNGHETGTGEANLKKLNDVLHLANELMSECLKPPPPSPSSSSGDEEEEEIGGGAVAAARPSAFPAIDASPLQMMMGMGGRGTTNRDVNMLLQDNNVASHHQEKMMIHSNSDALQAHRALLGGTSSSSGPSNNANPFLINPTPINEYAMDVVSEVKLGAHWNPQDKNTASLVTGLLLSNQQNQQQQAILKASSANASGKRPYNHLLNPTGTQANEVVAPSNKRRTLEDSKLDVISSNNAVSNVAANTASRNGNTLMDLLQGDIAPLLSHTSSSARASISTAVPAPVAVGSSSSTGGISSMPIHTSSSGRRHSASSTTSSSANQQQPFRQDQWNERYQDLVQYHQMYGDCLVPNHWPPNQPLSEWVKRQRYQYKLKMDRRPSYLSDQRMDMLNQLNFVWNMQRANWDEKWNELAAYKEQHGHCNVPSLYPKNRQLGIWVRCQRRQYRLYMKDPASSSGMTEERIRRLKSIGFVFELRRKLSKNEMKEQQQQQRHGK